MLVVAFSANQCFNLNEGDLYDLCITHYSSCHYETCKTSPVFTLSVIALQFFTLACYYNTSNDITSNYSITAQTVVLNAPRPYGHPAPPPRPHLLLITHSFTRACYYNTCTSNYIASNYSITAQIVVVNVTPPSPTAPLTPPYS